MKKKQKRLLVIIGPLIAVGLILLFLVLRGSFSDTEPRPDMIRVQGEGSLLTVDNDGTVKLVTSDGIYKDTWSTGQTDAFFSYFGREYPGIATGSVAIYTDLDGDELVNQVITDLSEGGGENGDDSGGNENGSGDDGSGSGGNGGENGDGDDGNGDGGSGGSGDEGESECLYWRLSYCVIFNTPPPTPTPVSGPGILPADCGDNIASGRTVIGNELCLVSPSPTPIPSS